MSDDKVFVDRRGVVEEFAGTEKRRHVRFPLCLAVKYGEEVPLVCADFTMNISKGGVYIMTDNPLPKGAKITMHFYIPPQEKLLGEFEGKVVGVNLDDPAYPRGMHVKFMDVNENALSRLEDYLEENRHLVDKEV